MARRRDERKKVDRRQTGRRAKSSLESERGRQNTELACLRVELIKERSAAVDHAIRVCRSSRSVRSVKGLFGTSIDSYISRFTFIFLALVTDLAAARPTSFRHRSRFFGSLPPTVVFFSSSAFGKSTKILCFHKKKKKKKKKKK